MADASGKLRTLSWPIVNCLGDVGEPDQVGGDQVANGAGELEDPMVGVVGKVTLRRGHTQEILGQGLHAGNLAHLGEFPRSVTA